MDGVAKRLEHEGWKYFVDPLQLLARTEGKDSHIIFRVEWPILESMALVSAVSLARRVLGEGVRVDVATPHPNVEWLLPAFGAGAERLFLAQQSCQIPWCGPEAGDSGYALSAVCPAMAQQVVRNHPVSLCRRHPGGMVVASHHLKRWCTGHRAECPFAGD